MPAVAFTSNAAPQHSTRPALCHVNMQIDCFLANSNPDDLRAIVRSLLATGPAGTSSAFTQIARSRMQHSKTRNAPSPASCFAMSPEGEWQPTPALWDFLSRARSVFGIGLGFESLPSLISLVTVTYPIQWDLDSEMEDALAVVDGDIAQAIQSCKEQVAAGRLPDLDNARSTLRTLKSALLESRRLCESWGGEFLFERALMSAEGWKL